MLHLSQLSPATRAGKPVTEAGDDRPRYWCPACGRRALSKRTHCGRKPLEMTARLHRLINGESERRRPHPWTGSAADLDRALRRCEPWLFDAALVLRDEAEELVEEAARQERSRKVRERLAGFYEEAGS